MSQFISLVCGLIVPHTLLGAFGSTAYGATASIASFLGYITLFEGGIAAVSRSTLYKALADKDHHSICRIVTETKQFFQKLALAFSGYVLVLACFYSKISRKDSLDFWVTFSLVIVIAISTFGEYFIGVSYSTLFQADQRTYIPTIFKIITTILNTGMVILLVHYRCSLIIVKLASSMVYILKPLALSVLARRRYSLERCVEKEKLLTQKKTAIGQHIAWVLHNNTDVAVLTIMDSLSLVSVYSVYYMIVGQIDSIAKTFTSGMEALFGDMYAKKEIEQLNATFNFYETLISLVSVTLFSVTMVLIVPFVRLYTAHIHDANYIVPTFGILLTIAVLMTSLRSPYGTLIIAVGHFKQTRAAAYGEAVINIVLSLLLAFRFGLIGVAIGTVVSTLYRWIFYVSYLSKNVLNRRMGAWLKRLLCNGGIVFAVVTVGDALAACFPMSNYLEWAFCAAIISILSFSVTFIIYFLLFRTDTLAIMRHFRPVRSNRATNDL
ncbi:MAG: polysaccharide biosynthesis C-terminal domain-containing protein [Eubacteriales bacterium]|nr:polysaccharide biosynthesis C-terminal domain-containing protein [Eubacteriales bacterium]